METSIYRNVQLTLADSFKCSMAGSWTFLPEAFLVALIKSDKAEATSLTALINRTYNKEQKKC